MNTCYCCGKIIFSKKVLGHVGNDVFTFCSEACRSKTWNKVGLQKADSTELSDRIPEFDKKPSDFGNKVTVRKSGSPSRIILDGAEYQYSAKTDRITIKVKNISNKGDGMTGALRLEMYLSKTAPYRTDTQYSGTMVAQSNEYESLKKNFNYTNITSTVRKTQATKPGTYFATIFLKELNEDGTWKIAAYANFPSQKWL